MSDLVDEPKARAENAPADKAESPHRPARPWLGRLATYLASFAGGMAVNDFSSSLGYHGLAGAVALSGVVAAATWIRGLNPRARLPRYAPWLFVIPAACLAAIAAFSSGPTVSILTAIAAVLTVGAVLVTKELLSAARLLRGVAFVALGAASIAFGSAALADRYALMGAASIVLGAAFIAYGAAAIADRDALMEMAKSVYAIASIPLLIAIIVDPSTHIGPTISTHSRPLLLGVAIVVTAASIASWAANTADRYALATGALIAYGVACIAFGASSITDPPNALMGAACISLGAASAAFGVARIGPRTIATRVRQVANWATKVPQGSEDQRTEPETGKN